MLEPLVDVIGGGLAGCEAAWQLGRRGIPVRLWEMRPQRMTEAHLTDGLAELVCSNSLGSDHLGTAGGVLKSELRGLGSLVISAADACRVPAGSALAVDRLELSAEVEARLSRLPAVEVRREEVVELPRADATHTIVATGPLTSGPVAEILGRITGQEHLYFYDAIAPIVAADSLDETALFRASRRQPDEPGDYLNIPLDRAGYEDLVERLLAADKVRPRPFEEERLFEACQPVESIAGRGLDTLRFGPMRPVGLVDPRTGERPYAVIQLRAENVAGDAYGLVGFQTRLRHGEQRTLLQSLPGLADAEFLRLGSIHRNTYIDAPGCLEPDLVLKGAPGIRIAGQLAGCEGYVESTALGLMAGLWTAAEVSGTGPMPTPARETVLGGLLAYLREGSGKAFTPMNANFGLLPPVPHAGRKLRRRERRQRMAQRAIEASEAYCEQLVAVLDMPR